jgi:hypothetical protein
MTCFDPQQDNAGYGCTAPNSRFSGCVRVWVDGVRCQGAAVSRTASASQEPSPDAQEVAKALRPITALEPTASLLTFAWPDGAGEWDQQLTGGHLEAAVTAG